MNDPGFYREMMATAPELLAPCVDDGCDLPLWPKAWATLQIDVTTMGDGGLAKLREALSTLAEVGVRFDTGLGFGALDCELDWSLRGAFLNVRRFRCSNNACSLAMEPNPTGFDPAYWSLYEAIGSGATTRMPYCSERCRDIGDAEWVAPRCSDAAAHGPTTMTVDDPCDHARTPGFRVIIHDVAEAWADKEPLLPTSKEEGQA